MTGGIQNAATAILCVCALVVTGLMVRDRLAAADAPASPALPGWEMLLDEGPRIGIEGAPVRAVVFSDYQCPACRKVHLALDTLRRRYPDRLTVVYRHLPLTGIHPVALEAAVAAECAAAGSRFGAFHDLLFAAQDTLAGVSWVGLATDAGIQDLDGFAACLASPGPRGRVAEDTGLARLLGLDAVPRFVIEGEILGGGAALARIRAALAAPE